MTVLKRQLLIARNGLRHNFIPHVLLCAAILQVIPFIMSINMLDARQSAVPLEMMVSVLGIILFPPVFLPERDEGTDAVVRSKKTPMLSVFCTRLAYLVPALLLLTGAFITIMHAQDSAVGISHFTATISSSALFGGIGLLAYALTNNPVMSYMAPALWYLICFGLGNKLGFMNAFAMTHSGTGKLPQLVLGIILIAAAVIIKSGKRR